MILCVKLINMCNSLIKITLNIETRAYCHYSGFGTCDGLTSQSYQVKIDIHVTLSSKSRTDQGPNRVLSPQS